jgi:L-asparaginase
LITHGTDTITDTAAFLAKENLNKTIVFTGALIPYSLGSSDGMFNLGSAFAFVQTLPVGVYIVMNGKYFLWDEVQKNRASGYFEKI